MITQFLQFIQIFHRSLTFCDLFKDLEHTSRTDPARRTFAARLIHCKLQEELRDIHHTGVLVHDDQSAGSHHGADLL